MAADREVLRGLLALAAVVLAGYLAGSRHHAGVTEAFERLRTARAAVRHSTERLAAAKEAYLKVQGTTIELLHERADLAAALDALPPAGPPGGAEGEDRGKNLAPPAAAADPDVPEPLRSYLPCRPVGAGGAAKQERSQRLPIYVLVAGVEGAGHHALETVWKELELHYDASMIGYNPGLHSLAKAQSSPRAYQFPSIDLERHKRRFRTFFQHNPETLQIDSRNSFPMGFRVGSVTHPDIAFLSQMDGELFDLRVVVLYRDPTDCTLSAVRRFKEGVSDPAQAYKNYEYQARNVQESLTIINNALRLLDCGKFMVLRYEEFVADPNGQVAPLAELLSVDEQVLRRCFGQLAKPHHHADDKTRALQRRHLRRFFGIQQKLWPFLTGQRPIPHVLVGGSREVPRLGQQPAQQPPAIGGQPARPAAGAVGRTGYLRIQWFTHLGFNNVRFILQNALYLASLLGRQLLVPPRLKMRACTDEALCRLAVERLGCSEDGKGAFWCPLSRFLDTKALGKRGALILEDEAAFLASHRTTEVKGAFERIYAEDSLWLERLPRALLPSIDKDNLGDRKAKFRYLRFHLGCELSYFRAVPTKWDAAKTPRIFGFVEEMERYRAADVLFLRGTPHHIGRTPTVWSSREALDASRLVWEEGVRYHRDVERVAHDVHQRLVRDKSTFVCVHLRRGDFVKLGWLGDAQDLALVQRNIESVLTKDDALYLATDERDEAELRGLRGIGARKWSDFRADLEAAHPDNPLLGFEDYVGLIEQTLCAEARRFIGSKCSSFTGGILDLRRRLSGDTTYFHVASKELGRPAPP